MSSCHTWRTKKRRRPTNVLGRRGVVGLTDTESEFVLKATALVDVISPVDTRLSLYMPTRLTITITRLMHTTTEYEPGIQRVQACTR